MSRSLDDSTQPSDETGIRFRSVAEKRLAERLLKKEGQWDQRAQTVLTKEHQLQERTHTFQKMHLWLQFSPELRHEEQAKDLALNYPKCPQELLYSKTKSSHLDASDPTPNNIEKKRIMGDDERSRPRPAGNRIISDDALQTVEQELLQTAASVVRDDSTRAPSISASTHMSFTPSGRGANAARRGASRSQAQQPGGPSFQRRSSARATASQPSPSPAPASRIEELKIGGDNQYSSLLMQLRKTRGEAEKQSKERSTLNSILTMDGSADLKRTITRMFADPKNAEAISQEEYERREKRWEEERKNQQKHELALLMDERAAINRELAHFGA